MSRSRFADVHDRAAAALFEGRLDEALAGLNRALALNPKSALAYDNRGSVFYARRDYAKAVADFETAIRLSPMFADAYMHRGIAYANLGRLDDALRDLDEAAGLDAKGSDVLYSRAIIHVRRKEYERAVADYEAAVRRDAGDAEASAARERLMTLLDQNSNEPGKRPVTLEDVDAAHLTAEIEHARQVDHILRIARSSCLAHGDDADGLSRLAAERQWQTATSQQLADGSSRLAQLIAGWTFTDRFGQYALMQSVGRETPAVVCSLTALVPSAHVMNDLKTAFEATFAVKEGSVIERANQTTHQYSIRRGDTPVRASMVLSAGTNASTLRFIFQGRRPM